jgi:hypothetical protein
MAKVSQRQVLAKIAPHAEQTINLPKFEGFRFAQVSGGEITASVEKIYEGGASSPTVLCAPFDIGDITLTAHYDDDRTSSDGESGLAKKVADLRSVVGKAYYDITVETYDCDLKKPGLDRLYSKALLVGLTEPDGDSSSGAPSTFALTFSVSTVASK